MRRHATEIFTVFELVNDRLKEIYVAHTDDMIFQIVEDMRCRPATAIKHWNLDDVRPVRSIEFDLTEEDARRFIANYLGTALPNGWRFLS